LNALNIGQIEIFISTEFNNMACTFNLAYISFTSKINWEEMLSFSGKLSYLLVVASVMDIYYSQHKVFGFKFILFIIKSIVLAR
jgi:hypothetical protein